MRGSAAAVLTTAAALLGPTAAHAGTVDSTVRLAMEGSVGVAYAACTSGPQVTPGMHMLTVSAAGTTVQVCKLDAYADEERFSNDVEVLRVDADGVGEAAARFVVVGENFQRDTFDSDLVIEVDGEETRPYDEVPATGL